MRTTEDRTLTLLLIAVSLAFAWILWPFYGAILWAIVFATVFAPAHRRLLATMRQNPNMAALATLLLIVAIALLPLTLTAMSVVREATNSLRENRNRRVRFRPIHLTASGCVAGVGYRPPGKLGDQRSRRCTDWPLKCA